MRIRLSQILGFVAVLLLAVLTVATPARAETELGKRLALVVGNSQYETLDSLKNAAADARLVADTLTLLGFSVTLLTDATEEQMVSEIARLKEEGKNAEAVLFYYSGHGFQLQGANYIVPVKAKLDDRDEIKRETVELNTLINELGNPDRPTIILIDACRNNPLAEDIRGEDGLAQVNASINNTYVLFATQPGNVSHDGRDNNGPFALALEANLMLPDTDFVAVMRKVRADVNKRTSGLQTPWEQSSMMVDFEFNIGLQPGVLLADLPAPAVILDEAPSVGTTDIVADVPLLVEVPDELVRGTPIETSPAIPRTDPAVVAPPLETQAPDVVGAPPATNPGAADPVAAPADAAVTPKVEEPAPIKEAAVDPNQVLAPLDAPVTTNDELAVAPPPAKVEPTIEPERLAELVQTELKRIGCYTSSIDGDWGRGSRSALARYFDAKNMAALGSEPTMEIQNILKEEPGIVCKVEAPKQQPVTKKKQPVVADNDAPAAPKGPKVAPKAAEPAAPAGGLKLKVGTGAFR